MENENPSCLPPAPWLVYTHGNVGAEKMQTFCTISSSPPYVRYFLKSIPQLVGKEIMSSNGGWFLLRDLNNLKMFTLWNPTSSRVIHLPPLNVPEDEVDTTFEGHDTLSALVCPPGEHGDGGDVNVHVFGDGVAFSYQPTGDSNSWIAQTTELNGKRAKVTLATTCNGIIYAYAAVRSGNEDGGYCVHFVIIEVNNHGGDFDGGLTLRLLQTKRVHASFEYKSCNQFLLASCGEVYTVGIYRRSAYTRQSWAVYVWKFDLCSSNWVPIKCLEGRAFFLGRRCCTWCWGNTNHNGLGDVRQNSVYFEGAGSQAIYIYSLEDCSLTSLLPCPSMPLPPCRPTWVMAQDQRLGKDEVHEIEKVHLLEQSFKALHCQELQDPNEQHGQHRSCPSEKCEKSSDALRLAFDNQKQNGGLGEFLPIELPLHLIELVAERMHLFDYLNFRAACKEFRSIAPVAGWRTNNSYPLLMFFESEESLCRLMDPCRSDSCCIIMPELFPGIFHIGFSKDGWLLMQSNKEGSLQFFNPFTRVRGEYPYSPFLGYFASVGFSTCPTTPDCVTVGMENNYGDDFVVYYHCFEEEMWDEFEFEQHEQVTFRGPLLTSPVYYKGAFYFLDERGYLGVFRLVDEEGTFGIHGRPETLGDDAIHSNHLVECDGELVSIFIGEMGKWIQVFRFDEPKKKWVRIESIGNHVLFLSPTSSFSMVARERGMANRIYLPRRYGNGVLFYALDTGKYSILTGEKSFEDFSGTKEHTRCCWI